MDIFKVRVNLEYTKHKEEFHFELDRDTIVSLFVVKVLETTSEFKISLNRRKMVEGIKDAFLCMESDSASIAAIKASAEKESKHMAPLKSVHV